MKQKQLVEGNMVALASLREVEGRELNRTSLRKTALAMRLLIHSAEQVVRVCEQRQPVLRGELMANVALLRHGAVVVDEKGRIADVGPSDDVREKWQSHSFESVIDASGKCVLPGFVDCHTHPVWSGDRVHEFIMKLSGATYLDIHKIGGGIYFTVHETAKSSEDELYELLKGRLLDMLRSGTTTVECKSGYGLELEEELKLLRVLERAKRELPMDICITYCGAHAIPKGKSSDEAVHDIVNIHVPKIKDLISKGELSVENIDVFCEVGVFSTEQSKQILQAGRDAGLNLNFHGDELNATGSAEMGSALGAACISHLEEISDAGIAAMAETCSVAAILPTTAYLMRLKAPPVRKLIAAGVPVALGTDFNPNAYCLSMPLVMNLACVTMGMKSEEALIASTLNAAAALRKSDDVGSIEVGKQADFIIINAKRWEHVIYQFGNHYNVVASVIKAGKIVYQNI